MKRSNNKLIIILMGLIIVVLVVIICIMGCKLKNLNNQLQNTEKETIQEDETNKQITEEESSEKQEEKKETEEDKRKKAIDELKKCLKDNKWVENNLSIKVSCFGEDITDFSNQKRTFYITKTYDNNMPMIYVFVNDDNALSETIFIVRYVNDKITVENFADEASLHNSHYIIAVANDKLCIEYGHMGYCFYEVYKISSTGEELIDKMEERESMDYKEFDEVESKYNLKTIETELNNSNVDKYVK